MNSILKWSGYTVLLLLSGGVGFFATLYYHPASVKQETGGSREPVVIIQGQEPKVTLPDPTTSGEKDSVLAKIRMEEADKLASSKPMEAIKRYKEAISADPQNVTIWEKAAKLATKHKQYDEASELFKGALVLREKSGSVSGQASALYWLARVSALKKVTAHPPCHAAGSRGSPLRQARMAARASWPCNAPVAMTDRISA